VTALGNIALLCLGEVLLAAVIGYVVGRAMRLRDVQLRGETRPEDEGR
jgi:hypothetical protein